MFHINQSPKQKRRRYQSAAWIWCNAHLGTPRPVADVAMLEMQWFISISMRKIWWFIFQSKSLQLHSSKLNVGRGWEASARSPDGKWAEKFCPKLFLSHLDALMHCIECMRALRPRAGLLHKYALQVCITQVCTPWHYQLAGLHLAGRYWGVHRGCTGWQLGEVWAADSIRSSGMPPTEVGMFRGRMLSKEAASHHYGCTIQCGILSYKM